MRYYITEAGKTLLETKIADQNLKIRNIQAEKNIAYTVSSDGWHDNPGCNQLLQLEERAITKLKNLEKQLNTSTIWNQPRSTKRVRIGSIVRFSM